MFSLHPRLRGQTTTSGVSTAKENVVLFVLDTLRPDHLHSYGNVRATSPNIDRLAQSGVRFSNYFTVAPWTSPSFATLHTSLYPSRHGVTLLWKPGQPLIDKDTRMLAEVFRDNGYYTTAFVNNALAGHDLTSRGFDEYYEYSASVVDIAERAASPSSSTAPATTERVLAWLDQDYPVKCIKEYGPSLNKSSSGGGSYGEWGVMKWTYKKKGPLDQRKAALRRATGCR